MEFEEHWPSSYTTTANQRWTGTGTPRRRITHHQEYTETITPPVPTTKPLVNPHPTPPERADCFRELSIAPTTEQYWKEVGLQSRNNAGQGTNLEQLFQSTHCGIIPDSAFNARFYCHHEPANLAPGQCCRHALREAQSSPDEIITLVMADLERAQRLLNAEHWTPIDRKKSLWNRGRAQVTLVDGSQHIPENSSSITVYVEHESKCSSYLAEVSATVPNIMDMQLRLYTPQGNGKPIRR